MHPPDISRATLADLESLAPLFDAYRVFYKQGSDLDGAHRYLRERMDREEAVVFLARDGARPIGFALMYPGFSSVSMGERWVLGDLFVDPSARRSGCARALMNACTDHCRSIGVCALWLLTAEDNTPAQLLYESMGWEWNRQYRRYTWKC